MSSLRVAAVQIGLEQLDNHQYEDVVDELVEEAVAGGAKFLCFPEHWPREETRDSVSNIIELMKVLASRYRVTMITGGFFEELPEGTYVTAPVVDPHGQILGRQKKIHLFAAEKSRARPGSDYEIFEANHVSFGVMICYDAAFPEVARTLALKGADIVFVPSRILAAGIQPWHLYLSARCLENRLPIVAPNLVWPPRYLGHSIILDLKRDFESTVVYPNSLVIGSESPEVLFSEVDLKFARELRESRLGERRPETYGLLMKPSSTAGVSEGRMNEQGKSEREELQKTSAGS